MTKDTFVVTWYKSNPRRLVQTFIAEPIIAAQMAAVHGYKSEIKEHNKASEHRDDPHHRQVECGHDDLWVTFSSNEMISVNAGKGEYKTAQQVQPRPMEGV